MLPSERYPWNPYIVWQEMCGMCTYACMYMYIYMNVHFYVSITCGRSMLPSTPLRA